MKLLDILSEVKKENNYVSSAELILPRGKKVVLQAEDQDYKRGLIVELLDNGGYEMAYWYDKPNKPYPVEILVDGKSIKEDGKIVEMKFHPQDYYDKQDMSEAELSKRDKKSLKKISKQLKKSVKSHDNQAKTIDKIVKEEEGKAAPYGSGYERVKKIVDESLRDWFKKEDWVRINTSGNISGKCGTMKKGKATTRCLPRKKAQSLTKAQRKATVAKKVRGSKKGKQFVGNTKSAKYRKKSK